MENQNQDNDQDQGILVSAQKLAALRSLIASMRQSSDAAAELLASFAGFDGAFMPASNIAPAQIEKVVEGVFDGERMIGSDGKQYAVPVNYASKSKLVEGDLLKLSVTDQGTMIYKQIQPIDRLRLTGLLEQSAAGDWTVSAGGKRYRILGASVTYFKGEANDEVIILIPKTGQSRWAAVEHIFKKA